MLTLFGRENLVHLLARVVFLLCAGTYLPLSFANQNAQGELEKFRTRVSQQAALEKKTVYYFYLFAYEGAKNKAKDSHTFASFVRVDPNKKQYWSTISWLPRHFSETKEICIFQDLIEAAKFEIGRNPCGPEEGFNYSLSETLQLAQETQKKVTAWGPYKIDKSFYNLGIERIRNLNSGTVKYLADDRKTRRNGTAINCMHAVSDIGGSFASKGGFLNIGYGIWGAKGSRHVFWHLVNSGYVVVN